MKDLILSVEGALVSLEGAVKLDASQIADLRVVLNDVAHHLRNEQQARVLAKAPTPARRKASK